MKSKSQAGFEEIPHTADWSIRIWAPDLEELFIQAANGMQTLMGLKFAEIKRERREIDVRAEDTEGLLVAFLNELLFRLEIEKCACDRFSLSLDGYHLTGWGECGRVLSINKEIKAVTYHRLKIDSNADGFNTTVVFDV
jgi:SHS2 domain-containing protein